MAILVIALDQFSLSTLDERRLKHLRIFPEVRRRTATGIMVLSLRGGPAMNCSIATADRVTHLKIVVVGFLCSTALFVAAIMTGISGICGTSRWGDRARGSLRDH
jgi:hypothetical protein